MNSLLNMTAGKFGVSAWIAAAALPGTGGTTPLFLSVALIMATAAIAYLSARLAARRWIPRLAARTPTQWDVILVKRGFFDRLAAMSPGIVVHALAGAWLGPEAAMAPAAGALRLAAGLWMLFFGVLSLHALLDGVVDIYNTFAFARQLPIRGFVQVIKLVAILALLVVSAAMFLGTSPALLISGMGAMTAVLMLVFKDPILGFVAGIQLSANRMLAVGDWLEMPKYNADGDVIDVTLTTVKVRNWDQTITTVPTYALIADSFKNWRGMSEAGGRRIMRSLMIDMNTVHFLDAREIERLRAAQLLSKYINDKIDEIERYNREHNVDSSSPVNGRKLTNIGTFRAYLNAYLKTHPGIHQGMIMMVRQLQPTPQGLPIQIYAFTRDTAWVAHEGVQADIFDHVLAVVPEFGLRIFQSPTGGDVRQFGVARTEGQ